MKRNYTKRDLEAVSHEKLAAFKKEMGPAVYQFMIARCHDPKCPAYRNYGGRGITVCNEWRRNPDAFYLFAMARGWKKGLQLDREDNSKGYSPTNCRFVTPKENCRNTRANVPVECYDRDGNLLRRFRTITEAAEYTSTATNTVQDSMNKVIDIASGKYRFRRIIDRLPNWIIPSTGKSVKVENTKTGETEYFLNENRAAKRYMVNHVSIRHWCMGMKCVKPDGAENLRFTFITRREFNQAVGAGEQLDIPGLFDQPKHMNDGGFFQRIFRRIMPSFAFRRTA